MLSWDCERVLRFSSSSFTPSLCFSSFLAAAPVQRRATPSAKRCSSSPKNRPSQKSHSLRNQSIKVNGPLDYHILLNRRQRLHHSNPPSSAAPSSPGCCFSAGDSTHPQHLQPHQQHPHPPLSPPSPPTSAPPPLHRPPADRRALPPSPSTRQQLPASRASQIPQTRYASTGWTISGCPALLRGVDIGSGRCWRRR